MSDKNSPINQLVKLIQDIETYPSLSLAVLVEEFTYETVNEFSDRILIREPVPFVSSNGWSIIGSIKDKGQNLRIINIVAIPSRRNNKENTATLLYAWKKAKISAEDMNGLPGILTVSAGHNEELKFYCGWLNFAIQDYGKFNMCFDNNYCQYRRCSVPRTDDGYTNIYCLLKDLHVEGEYIIG